MAERPPSTDTGREPDFGMPRWVKALGIVALVLAVLFTVLHLAFGDLRGHGP